MSHELTKLMVAVDTFAAAMKRKLLKKAEEGYTGWNTPGANCEIIKMKLHKATDRLLKGDRDQGCDVGNLTMMLTFMPSADLDSEDGDVAGPV